VVLVNVLPVGDVNKTLYVTEATKIFTRHSHQEVLGHLKSNPTLGQIKKAIDNLFVNISAKRTRFSRILIQFYSLQVVREELSSISYGHVVSYTALMSDIFSLQ